MHDFSSRRLKMIVAFAIVYFVWGSTYLAIRFAVETLPPFGMAGARFVLAGAALYSIVQCRQSSRPSWRQWVNAAAIGSLMFGGGNGLVCWAEQSVPSGLASLIIATTPLWMTLLDWSLFHGLRPNTAVAMALALGMAGIVVLVDPAASLHGVDPWGATALLIACFTWSYGSLRSRQIDLPDSPFVTAGMQMLGGGAFLAVCSLLVDDWGVFELESVSARSLWALAWLIVFGSMLALSAYTWLIRNCPASMVSTYAWVNPVIALLLGAWLGGESLSLRSLAAGGLILISVLLILSQRRRQALDTKIQTQSSFQDRPPPTKATASD
jgi:drug/metabolite transporter (DMT)-like permease